MFQLSGALSHHLAPQTALLQPIYELLVVHLDLAFDLREYTLFDALESPPDPTGSGTGGHR
jgi:hypothetical protein